MVSVGFNTIFEKQCPTVFVIKNTAPGNKTVRVFNYPILKNAVRDLMEIPYVSEADIRHSLLKGELNIKIRCGEIKVTDANIDLLQFDDCHKAFLQSAGITNGLEVAGTGDSVSFPFLFRERISLIGTQDGINRSFTTPDDFIEGTLSGNELHIKIMYNGRDLIKDIDYLVFESGGVGTGFNTIAFISFVPQATPKGRLVVDYFTPA